MATLSVRLDDKTKDDFSKFCDTVGMSVSSLFSVFAKTVVREQRIPFEISVKSAPSQDDGFYSEANQRYLEKAGQNTLKKINRLLADIERNGSPDNNSYS